MKRLVIVLVLVAAFVVPFTAEAKAPPLYKNCTNLNKKYRHGIGRARARDRTSGKPVTNFFRSDRLYRIAMSYNRGLDRDHDGIACESA
jgi:hypothetical protein